MVNFWKQFFLWLLKPSKKSFGIGLMIEKCLIKYFSPGSKRG